MNLKEIQQRLDYHVRRLNSMKATMDDVSTWVSANSGPSSGLDADTVDGQHAASFATASAVTTINSRLDAIEAALNSLVPGGFP